MQGIVQKYELNKKWFYLYGALCRVVHLQSVPGVSIMSVASKVPTLPWRAPQVRHASSPTYTSGPSSVGAWALHPGLVTTPVLSKLLHCPPQYTCPDGASLMQCVRTAVHRGAVKGSARWGGAEMTCLHQGVHQLLRGLHRVAVRRGVPAPAQPQGPGLRPAHGCVHAAHHLPPVQPGALLPHPH